MNSGPSATFGIMFSVTNSGSSNRLTSGDQVNITASMTPTSAPRQNPPRISDGRHREIGKPGIVGRAQRRDGRKRRGQDEFRHLEGVDQNLPEHDHGQMHDQDDRERPYRSSVTAEHRMLPSATRPVPGRVAAIYRGLPH